MTIDIGGNDSTDTRPGSPGFEKPALVLVEGRDDQSLLQAIVENLGLGDTVEVFEMRGKSDWVIKVRTIAENPLFAENVRAIGLVRDADQDADAGWQSCLEALSAIEFPRPTNCVEPALEDRRASAVLIVPDRSSHGAIEELWLRAVGESWLACIEAYLDCVSSLSPGKRTSKNRTKAFLAGARRHPPTLGVAFRMGSVDREHEAFDDPKRFLRNLANSVNPG